MGNIKRGGKVNNGKKKLVIGLLTCIIIIVLLFVYSTLPVIFQEGNPIPIIKGIIELNSDDDGVVKIGDDPIKYLTRDGEDIANIFKSQGYETTVFFTQCCFKKGNEKIRVMRGRMYSSNYIIWIEDTDLNNGD